MAALIGTAPNQVPVNGLLGTGAFIDARVQSAYDRNRANHTGTQDQSTVDGLPADLAALQGRQLALGDGQTWQDVTVSRTSNVNYTNTTGRPIELLLSATSASSTSTPVGMRVTAAGRTARAETSIPSVDIGCSILIMAGETYSWNAGFTDVTVWELR